MSVTWLQIGWLFFVYSLAGWVGEVCSAAIHSRKFVNRGFVNGFICPIYGFAAVLNTLFLQELRDNLLFLFLGGTILSTVLEYSTGMILKKIFNRKLWDYSKEKWNLEGFICLKYSLIWGIFAVAMMKLFNPLLIKLVSPIPTPLSWVLLWAFTALFAFDLVSTALAVLGMQKEAARFAHFTEGLQKTSKLLENTLTRKIQSRMMKSFPSISRDAIVQLMRHRFHARKKPKTFAEGNGFYKLFCLFLLGAFAGDIVETLFCLLTTGKLMSRSSVVYGPFSIVWGLACALLTAFLYRYKDRSVLFIFLAGTLLGGAYEYICSVFTELVFGTVFWDYSGFTLNLGGRVNLLFCFFWGMAAVVWFKRVYPFLSRQIEKLPIRLGTVLCNCMLVFMLLNMAVSALAMTRYTQRHTPSPDGPAMPPLLADFLDDHFDDERMSRIYPNAKVVIDGEPKSITPSPLPPPQSRSRPGS